ncbi:AI-2E family transporter [Thermomonas flagellata]|uniref:AI-2E family transporter n=1 Tax=Thermomonas flagellata TaxID=2888524 RepID=UPI001F04F7C7|nr:AI-2E family transporter [Thermomonas flagellata]
MTPSNPEPPAPAPRHPPVPRTPRPRAPLAVVVLMLLALGYTLWLAQAVVLPVLLAMFFALVGNPILRLLQRLRVPRALAALAVLCAGLALAALLAAQLVKPATAWVREAPRELRELAPRLQKLTRPVQEAGRAAENIARAAGGDAGRPATVVRADAGDPYRALFATPRVLAALLAVILLTFFFMVYGQRLLRHALMLLPDAQQQKLTVGIVQAIEREISRYVLTISLINAALGLLLAAGLHLLLGIALDEALLWGTLAMLLNFAPYLGPLLGVLALLAMGVVSFREPLQVLAPAGLYLGLHLLEGQLVTPVVLGRTMALSPLVLILALMVFGGLWGVIGLLLAVPLLVCTKLVLARIDGLQGWARLLE